MAKALKAAANNEAKNISGRKKATSVK